MFDILKGEIIDHKRGPYMNIHLLPFIMSKKPNYTYGRSTYLRKRNSTLTGEQK